MELTKKTGQPFVPVEELALKHTLTQKHRLLFGFSDWPTGILEVASWAKKEGLAEPSVFFMSKGENDAVEAKKLLRKHLPGLGVQGSRFFLESGDLNLETKEAVQTLGVKFLRKLLEFKPDIVGFRLEGNNTDELKTRIAAVRRFSDAAVVVGGPTPTTFPKEVLEESGATYVFAGDAEESFNMFLKAYNKGKPESKKLLEIPGLAFKHAGKTYHNTAKTDGYGQPIGPLDRRHIWPETDTAILNANRPDWSIVENIEEKVFDVLYVSSSRGCPGDCTFCAHQHGNRFRQKIAKNLMEEITELDGLISQGKLKVQAGNHFKHVDDKLLKDKPVIPLVIYDEDPFVDKGRMLEFFRLWDESPLKERYRLMFQANPRSLLKSDAGIDDRPEVDERLLMYVDKFKARICLGGESFHDGVLKRWNKRHNVKQLRAVIDAFEKTGQEYYVYMIMSDYDMKPDEYIDSLRLLASNHLKNDHMRITANRYAHLVFDSDMRKSLEFTGRLSEDKITHFSDYRKAHPELMDPFTRKLVEDSEALYQVECMPEAKHYLYGLLFSKMLSDVKKENNRLESDPASTPLQKQRIASLKGQIEDIQKELNLTA